MGSRFLPAEVLSSPRPLNATFLLIGGLSAAAAGGMVAAHSLARSLRPDGDRTLLPTEPTVGTHLGFLVCGLAAGGALWSLRHRPLRTLSPAFLALAVIVGSGLSVPFHPPHEAAQWARSLARDPATRPLVATPLLAGGATSLAVFSWALLLARNGTVRPEQWVHGSAKVAERRDLIRAGLLGSSGGMLLGAWGAQGDRELLRDCSDHHALVVIPPGGGKTTGPVLGTLLTETRASAFVVDPKAELFTLSSGWRQHQGHRCLRFAPSTSRGLRWNLFDEIQRGPGEYRVLSTVAENLVVYPSGLAHGDHWVNSARTLFRALALHILYAHPQPSLRAVLDLLNDPSGTQPLESRLRRMAETPHDPDLARGWTDPETGHPTAVHPEVARVARALGETPDRERGSILSTLNAFLALWADERIADATSESDFLLRDLAAGDEPQTLYITLPYQDLERLGPILRIMLSVLTLCITDQEPAASARGTQTKLLLVLDEFRALGRVPILEQMLAFLRGYGVRALVAVQDLAQLRQVYSDRESITGNCQIQVFSASQNVATRSHVSRLAGEATVRYRKRSVTAGKGLVRRPTRSHAEARRPLVTEGEVGSLPPDRLLILKAGVPPILARKLPYFEHPELLRRASLAAASESKDEAESGGLK